MASMAPAPSDKPKQGQKRKDPPSGSRPSNRPAGKDGRANGGRPNKWAKLTEARSIRSQPADAALKDGELDLQAFLNAREFEIKAMEDGMKKSKAFNNRRAFQLVPRSMRRRTASHNVKKLPKRLRARARREQIDDNTPVVEARKRKPRTTRARIRAETAKKLAILALRRRRRKLKEAAEKEGGHVEGPASAMKQLIETRPARPKIRRNQLNDPPKPKAKFRKRQIDKTWLPTHLWHAKRARMTTPKEPLWRFTIPMTPTEKCYRPTHRASGVKGAVVWDMSYMSTIGLYGTAPGIERTMKALGTTHDSLWDNRGKKWREGRRKWSGVLSREKGDVRRVIGPATVIWNPETPKEVPRDDTSAAEKKTQRQLFIRLHPSCFLEVFNVLTKLVKRETPRLYVEDLRFEIGSIELTGAGSTEALLGILRPYHTKEGSKEAHAKLFESLTAVNNAASLPADALLAFSAQDPRLCYPPRTLKAEDGASDASNAKHLETLSKWSVDESTAPFLLFDRNARFKASCLPSQQALNRRKGENAPGKHLGVTIADPPIPIVLFASRSPAGRQAQGTWTLLAPWKCILPIWYSLVHYPLSTGGNPRFGGLDELRQVAFEQGLPWFPSDYPGTDAGAEWELEQRAKRKADWDRRPKSKRVAWDTLDLGAGRKGEIGMGWACEFERLFGLQESEEDASDSTKDCADAVSQNADEMDVDEENEGGASLEETNSNAKEQNGKAMKKKPQKKSGPHPLTFIHHVSRAAFNALATTKKTEPPPPHSIITVRITCPGRGVPEPCARIYRLPSESSPPVLPSIQAEVPATDPPPPSQSLPSDLRDQWLAKLHSSKTSSTPNKTPLGRKASNGADFETRKRLLALSLTTGADTLQYPRPAPNQTDIGGDHPLVPGEENLIGYVTKGEFNLVEGKGAAIGCISAERALEALRVSEKEGRVCVVRNTGETVGWVARWEVL